MSDLREYVKDRLARYPGMTCALHHDLRHWLVEHPPSLVTADLRAEIEVLCAEYALLSGDTFRRVTADLTGALLAAHPVQVTTAEPGWTETDLRPYLNQLAQYAKELASLTATTSGEEETP